MAYQATAFQTAGPTRAWQPPPVTDVLTLGATATDGRDSVATHNPEALSFPTTAADGRDSLMTHRPELSLLATAGDSPQSLMTHNSPTLVLPATIGDTRDVFVGQTQELFLPASASFDPGGPGLVVIRLRVFTHLPSRWRGLPPLRQGENEIVTEPVIYFDKDALVALDFTILNPDGTAYNLSSASVELLARPERGATLVFPMTVADAANGKARRVVQANDFAAGAYQAQLRITSGAAKFHTTYFRILVGTALA